MSRFPLREKKVAVRETTVTVRELTQGERTDFVKLAGEDKFRGPALLVSLGMVDPAFTEQEAAAESAEIIEQLAGEIMALSGMGGEVAKKD